MQSGRGNTREAEQERNLQVAHSLARLLIRLLSLLRSVYKCTCLAPSEEQDRCTVALRFLGFLRNMF